MTVPEGGITFAFLTRGATSCQLSDGLVVLLAHCWGPFWRQSYNFLNPLFFLLPSQSPESPVKIQAGRLGILKTKDLITNVGAGHSGLKGMSDRTCNVSNFNMSGCCVAFLWTLSSHSRHSLSFPGRIYNRLWNDITVSDKSQDFISLGHSWRSNPKPMFIVTGSWIEVFLIAIRSTDHWMAMHRWFSSLSGGWLLLFLSPRVRNKSPFQALCKAPTYQLPHSGGR